MFYFVVENGDLFVWGSGSEGQLGLGAAECEQPSLLKFRSKVTFVACGYYHTAVITGKYHHTCDLLKKCLCPASLRIYVTKYALKLKKDQLGFPK